MDNKKWYKRLNTVFWWILSILPLILFFVYFIMAIVNLNTQGGTPLEMGAIGDYFSFNDLYDIFDLSVFETMGDFIPSFISNTIESVLVAIGVRTANVFTIILSWFISIHIYHLIVDVLVWLPNMLHKLIDKYQD